MSEGGRADGSVQCRLDHGLVFDVGAHLGEDSDFYLKLGYRVVAIEANPDLVTRLVERFESEIEQGRYVVVSSAIGESNDRLAFYVNETVSVWGTTERKWAIRNDGRGAASKRIEVSSIRFEEVLRRHGYPLYMKVDIEGADLLCVRALECVDATARPMFVSIESTKTSWRALLEEFDTFERLGYTRFQIVDQRRHSRGSFRTLDQGAIDYQFEAHASGPFGADLVGPWLTRRQALTRYMRIFVLYKTIGDNTLLRKALRRVPKTRTILGRVSWYDTHAMKAT